MIDTIFSGRSPGALLGILAAAAWLALSGLNVVPLDTHEIFVVQTAEEMHDRGEYIVPTLGGELRLKKPPLSYWCTVATAKLFGDREFQPWHGRLPSALSGLGIAALTLWMGRMLFSGTVGVLAAGLLITSEGYITYTHSARPEMLYSFWCLAALALFLRAWRSGTGRRWAAYGMWAAMALATLAKGPHIPAAFLISFILILRFSKSGAKKSLSILRPAFGLLIFMLIALPWWLWVYLRVDPQIFQGSQLTGSRFELDFLNFFEPYYFFRFWQLLLPWVLLWPATLKFVTKPLPVSAGARILAGLILTVVLILNFGGHKRWYYLLPLLAPACLWMSLAARKLFLYNPRAASLGRWLVPLHLLVLPVAVAAIGIGNDRLQHFNTVQWAYFLTAIGLIVAIYLTWHHFSADGALKPYFAKRSHLTALFAGFFVFFSAINLTGAGNNHHRWNQVRMAHEVTQKIPLRMPLATYRIDKELFIYYCDRPVQKVDKLPLLGQLLSRDPGGRLAVVVSSKYLRNVTDRFAGDQLVVVRNSSHDGDWHLVVLKSIPALDKGA